MADSAIIVRMRTFIPALVIVSALALLSACRTPAPKIVEPQPVAPQTPVDPLATHMFTLEEGQNVVGEIQVTRATHEDTLSEIARRFNLGYEELVRANPGVDPWLPGEGREIVLPTRFVLPDAPHTGLVVNLAALRLYYFPKPAAGEPQKVITHPIGIGKVGWNTPEGTTKVVKKRKNPTWTPPASVRKEHAERDDPLPKVVPPGDENPLGAYAMNLGWSSYLIHGTNKPYGVGLRSSHGCIRLYPEDIALLFDEIPVGTPVHVVNQRVVSGWQDNHLYVQVMPPAEEELAAKQPASAKPAFTAAASERLQQQAKQRGVVVNMEWVDALLEKATGVAAPVSKSDQTLEQYLVAARRVENRLPAGATWNGSKELLVTAEQYEAMRTGTLLPAPQSAAPAKKKTGSKGSL